MLAGVFRSRVALVSIVLAVVTAACSQRPSIEIGKTHRSTTTSTTSAGGTADNGAAAGGIGADGGASGAKAGAGGGPAGTTGGATAANAVPTAAQASKAAPAGSPATAAGAALDGYLNAIARRDKGAVDAQSTNGPNALATIRLLIAGINEQAGASTTVRFADESFQPASTSATRVTFNGSIQLATEVRGARGTDRSTSTIDGPVTVVLDRGGWKVKDFSYESKPMAYFNENASTGHDGMTVSVAFVLSYGAAADTIVIISSDTGQLDPGIKFHDAQITVPAGTAPSSGFAFEPGSSASLLLLFPRTDQAPTKLDVGLSRPDGTVLHYVVTFPAST